MSEVLRILVIEPPGSTASLRALCSSADFRIQTEGACPEGLRAFETFRPGVVILDGAVQRQQADGGSFERLLQAVDAQGAACLFRQEATGAAGDALPEWVQVIGPQVDGAELFGRLSCIAHYQQIVNRAQLEMRHLQRLGRHLNRRFVELDHDMRLASRLQREFLPGDLPQVPGLDIAVLFRPANWVSGDIYDVSFVDEDHLSFYVADAVGHGMAASLLTMFVKRAMQNKDIDSGGYRILSPSETLLRLNESLAREKLDNSQYVTAAYGLLNHKTMTVRLARGGHPHPLLVQPDGQIGEIRVEGGLLGLFTGQEFPGKTVQLQPGQKLILHSDGMELAFVEDRDGDHGHPRYRREFQKVARLEPRRMVSRLESLIDDEEGSLNPQDDVTVVVIGVSGC